MYHGRYNSVWKLGLTLLVVGCSFEHGELQPIDARNEKPIIDAPHQRDPASCLPPPSPTCVLFTCPGSDHCYYECGRTPTSKATWVGAVGACTQSQRGCIATINDQLEQDCIAAATMPMFPDAVWLGYHQPSGASEPAEDWAWQCGTSAFAPAWGASQPDNAGAGENCAAMTDAGDWIDADCSGTARFVCELQ